MTEVPGDERLLLRPIQATLRRLIRRHRAALLVRGVLCTLAAALVGVLAVMGVRTQWLPMESWHHYALTGAWVLAAGAAACLTLIRPLARSFTLTGAARMLEQRHPEMKERISSAVELLSSTDAPEIRGSASLIHALATEAVGDARGLRPRREVSFRRARPPLVVLLVAAAVIAAVLVLYPEPGRILLAKTLLPTLNLPSVRAGDLRITPGDCTLAAGRRLEVRVEVTGPTGRKVRSAECRLRAPDRPEQAVAMSRLGDRTFGYTTPALTATLEYRIRAGDARSRYYTVRVVPRPAVQRIEVGYRYPDYTKRPEAYPSAAPGDLDAPAGTLATVHLRLNKPVDRPELRINDAPGELTPLDASHRAWSFRHRLRAGGSGRWRLTLTDRHGIGGEPVARAINVRTDLPPRVRIVSPAAAAQQLPPTDTVPVRCRLTDDVGVGGAELLVRVDGTEQPPVRLPVRSATTGASRPATAPSHVELTAPLDLAALDLAGARQVTFQVRGWDNLPGPLGGPQEGRSGIRTIDLAADAQPYVLQVQLALDLRIREALEAIHRRLTAAKKLSAPLRRSMPSTKALAEDTLAKVDALRERLREAEAGARDLAEATAGGAYPKLSEKLIELADAHVGKARELAGLIKITDAVKRRAQMADEADFQVDRSLAIVSELLKQFQVWTEQARRAMELELLARRQEELAARRAMEQATTMPATAPSATTLPAGTSEPADPDRPDNPEWRKQQRELARDVGEMLRQTPGGEREALQRQQKRTQVLDDMADKLRTRQQALMDRARQAERTRGLKADLAKLAEEQAKLAGEIGEFGKRAEPVRPTTRPAEDARRSASEAAKLLSTTRPAEGVRRQAAAAKALDEAADQARQEPARHASATLAEAAEQMARKEAELAARSARAAGHRQQAQAAQKAADEAATRQQELSKAVAGRTAELARRQAELARRARQVESAARPAETARPAADMERSAKGLTEGDPGAAASHAGAAAKKAEAMAREVASQADSAKAASEKAARKAAAAKADGKLAAAAEGAGKRAEEARRQAAAARKAADEASRRSQAAAARARQASAKAEQAAKTADAAAKRAKQAAEKADASGAASDRQAAADAARQAAQAAKAREATRRASASAASEASTAKRQSASAGKAAEAAEAGAARAAEQAKAARDAAEAPARAAREAAERASSSRAHAGESRKIADEQAELTRRIAAAAQREAAHVAQATQAARRAADQRTAAEEADKAAAKALAGAPKEQEALNRRLGEIKRQSRHLTPAARAALRRHDPTRQMQQASRDLAAGQADSAAKSQEAAAERLRQIARAARQPHTPAPPAKAAETAKEAAQLARRQRQLQSRAAQLLGQLARAEGRRRQEELTRLRAEQQRIAREAAKLADEVGEQAPQPDRIDRQAARDTQAAADRLARRQLDQAQQTGRRAAEALGELSDRLGDREGVQQDGEGEPGPQRAQGEAGQESAQGEAAQQGRQSGQGQQGRAAGERRGQVRAAAPSGAQEPEQVAAEQAPNASDRRAELGRRAGELARRQQRVAEQAAALARDDADALLASRQRDIAEGTRRTRQGADLLAEHIEDLMPEAAARQLADAAREALADAAGAQADSEQALGRGRPGESVPSQDRAQRGLGRAAQALARLGQMARSRAQKSPPAPEDGQPQVPPGQLADAYEAAQSAAQGRGESDAERAARMLAALARQAADQARAMGLMPMQGMPGQMARGFVFDSRVGVGRTGAGGGEAGLLKELGLSPSDWTRLPDHLRDQVLQAARREGPPEYRTLIKHYFQALARQGAPAAVEEEGPDE